MHGPLNAKNLIAYFNLGFVVYLMTVTSVSGL